MGLSTSNNYRSSGVLLHPSSLPNSPICGGFGAPARQWLKLLAENKIGVWQFLPLAPTDSTGSPYSSPSGFSYNPWFLDVNDLVNEEFLPISVLDEVQEIKNIENSRVDFKLANLWSERLGVLLRESWESQENNRHVQFQSWCTKQFWLEDHALFMEMRRQNNNLPWWEWNLPFAQNNTKEIKQWSVKYQNNLLEQKLLQWHLDRQWQLLKQLAKDLGVVLFGDLPFYVSRDSVDVWSNRSLFSVLTNGALKIQSGVPPDYFSSTGQLWGTPVYRWKKHQVTKYQWWRSRFHRHLNQVDLLRVDHFRAFDSFWAVPGHKTTAEDGYWSPSPGLKLLNLLEKDLGGKLPLVAEDLGVITDSVERLRDYFSLPGMKILQFAFDGSSENPYLPENISGNEWIVYTGTHDNSTATGWWNEIDDDVKKRVLERVNSADDFLPWNFIKMGLETDARLFICPLQDLLGLDNKARLNRPGTIENNWDWRMKPFDKSLSDALNEYSQLAINSKRSFEDAIKLI